MKHTEWRERIIHRSDITTRITHLTNGVSAENAFENLISILTDKKIKGGMGYINGNIPVVCLQESPLSSIAENLLHEKYLREVNHTNLFRYRAFGLRFEKIHIFKLGGRPVIYANKIEMKDILPVEEHWRIVDMKLNDLDNVVDWSHEREWRIKKNLDFEYNEVEVIVQSVKYYRKLVSYCEENNRMDILKGIRGIVTLDSVFR